ncbi:hypothetical protein R1flu_003440 [Riccia fluitans]|uniref:DUF4246 domain-containing protein n=1 Tax=Riccia fluitans TaxID=41844 RepID=A0ABD1Y923_9MARC
MLPRVIKACLYPKGHLMLISGRRRRNKHSSDGGDQCLMVPRDSTSVDHGPAIYVKDGLGEWALMQPPPPIPVDAVIDFEKLRNSIGASQAEVRRRIREPLTQKGKGIYFVDNVVPTYLRHLILTRLDSIANKPNKDFHPGTDHMVQDLIHPSLFSYIEGVSPIIDPATCPKKKHSTQNNCPNSVSSINSMGREFERQEEESKYQWLPSQFYVSPKGSVKVKSYINNLDEATNRDLYTGIELLFELFLPMFENILPEKQLRGRELQVIVKAVNYVIQPKGHMYEGVWHVDGLGHEHILASGLYYYSTSPCLKDGGLEFRPIRRERELNPTPAGEMIEEEEDMDYHVFDDIRGAYRTDTRREPRSNQSRLATLRRREWLRVRSMVGSVPTPENRLLVFPNNLQHKVSGIVNDAENEVGRRKTLMFFLVDPDVDIVSTRDVYEQQWDKLRPQQRATLNEVAHKIIGRSFPVEILDEIISRAKRGLTMAEARAHRLQLIKDRHMKFECDNDDYS